MRTDTTIKMVVALLLSLLFLSPISLSARQIDNNIIENDHQSIEEKLSIKPAIVTSSFGKLKSKNLDVSPVARLKNLAAEQAILQSLQDEQKKPVLYKSRQQHIKDKREKENSSLKNLLHGFESFYYSFSIYDAYAQLIEDFDGDGFYQTFSVSFDADLITNHILDNAVVYAELYLSENGGPWLHYFTTDNFIIYGESSEDEYEVYTTLNNGYISANYDVLIDLYEDGYSDIVASFSANDSSNLYALPLESSNYDPDYNPLEISSHGHGGSSSLLFLLAMFITVLMRQQRQKTTS